MPVEYVAELSANHLGSLDRALEIVEAAADAGATHFKLQTWVDGTMCLDRDYVIPGGPWKGRRLFDLYREAYTPWSWHKVIFDYVRAKGMTPFSAAFDRESVDFLEGLGVDRHKVASFELTDLPLIRYMASKGKPIILSTGMANVLEIDAAAVAAAASGRNPILLACTSAYPADPADARLRAWKKEFFKWGLSDHTHGHGVAVAAVALGACYVEKHLSIDTRGLDGHFSMLPAEFAAMVDACRQAEAAIAPPSRAPGDAESTALRRSLWACKDIKPGEHLRLGHNVATARPALGVPPSTKLGRAALAVKAGQPITREVLG